MFSGTGSSVSHALLAMLIVQTVSSSFGIKYEGFSVAGFVITMEGSL